MRLFLYNSLKPSGRINNSTAARGILLLLVLAVAIPAASQTRQKEEPPYISGKLLTIPSTGLVLRADKKDIKLSARTSYLFHTLQDKRLANREVRLEGMTLADGSFEVAKFFTVKDGKLYRVRYYCEICNIEALEPGPCVCCQQPTELQEIPVPDAK